MKDTRAVSSSSLVVFGSTGDLAVKKIFPALEALHKEGVLGPDVEVIAVSRREWGDAEMLSFLESGLGRSYDESFGKRIKYAKVDIEQGTGYRELGSRIQGEPVVYLSLGPSLYPKAAAGLKAAKILSRGKGKILIEKPFGTDERSATELNEALSGFLDDEQIYRVDHYLGKETLRAAMDLRESGPWLNELLSKENVETIRAVISESIGINGRGATYDGVGAFRDIGQNHALEMLAAVAADISGPSKGKEWQKARTDVFKRLAPPAKTCEFSRRGQYEGYLKESGVRAESNTETAFEVVTSLSGGRLAGVPVILAGGKKMLSAEAFVDVDFKDRPDLPRRMFFRIQPDQRVVIVNRDGSHESFDVPRRRDAYANVISNALLGETEDFVGAEEIQALWSYADRVVSCWEKVPLEIYSESRPFLIQ